MDYTLHFQRGTSRLAIDVGNVISQQQDTDESSNNEDSVFATATKHLTPTIECANACRALVNHFGVENSFILSKCKRRMQLATVRFLERPIDGGESFFQRTGLNPRNVIFCTQRSGGTNDKLRFTPLDENYPLGPRVAIGDVGKGAVARKLCLTHMIDDRDDCLLSFMCEGHLMSSSKKGKMQHNGALLHFGSHAATPRQERITQFLQARGIASFANKKLQAAAVKACIQAWVPVEGWTQVLASFGIIDTPTQGDAMKNRVQA